MILQQPATDHTPNFTAALQALSNPELDAVYARALDQVTVTHYLGRREREVSFWRVLCRTIYCERLTRCQQLRCLVGEAGR